MAGTHCSPRKKRIREHSPLSNQVKHWFSYTHLYLTGLPCGHRNCLWGLWSAWPGPSDSASVWEHGGWIQCQRSVPPPGNRWHPLAGEEVKRKYTESVGYIFIQVSCLLCILRLRGGTKKKVDFTRACCAKYPCLCDVLGWPAIQFDCS